MERDTEKHDELIDLGAASTSTMGPGGQPIDEFLGQAVTGLADD